MKLTIRVAPSFSSLPSFLSSFPPFIFFFRLFSFCSFLTGSTDGTKGYQSGEFVRYKNDEHEDKNWRPNNDDFKRADMFAFGVLAYFVLGKGSHPFSDPRRPNRVPVREDRIADEVPPNLEAVEDWEARHLIEKCVEHNAEERPSGERAAAHPYFYGTEKSTVLGYTTTPTGWKQVRGGMFSSSGRLAFTPVQQIQVVGSEPAPAAQP